MFEGFAMSKICLNQLIRVALLIMSTSAMASTQVEIFLESEIEIEFLDEFDFSVYVLSDRQRVMQLINAQMPSDPDQAEAYARQLVQEKGEAYAKRIAAAERGHFLKHQYQITRFPAFVFDEKYIVEGAPDLKQAIEEYQLWLSESY